MSKDLGTSWSTDRKMGRFQRNLHHLYDVPRARQDRAGTEQVEAVTRIRNSAKTPGVLTDVPVVFLIPSRQMPG
jgi:hypothetical protein